MTMRFLATLIACFIGVAAFAQGRIDKIIDDLEKKTDVETTYSERRSARGRKLYRVTTMMTFSNAAYYKRLAKAFEDERSNSVSAVKSRTQLTYRFQNDKGTSTYTLTRSNNNWTLVKSWRSSDDHDDDVSEVETQINADGNVLVTTSNTVTVYNNGSTVTTVRCGNDSRESRAEARQARREARQAQAEARREARAARAEARRARQEAREARAQAREFERARRRFERQRGEFERSKADFERQRRQYEQQVQQSQQQQENLTSTTYYSL